MFVLWFCSLFVALASVLIFWYSPRIEIVPKILSVNEATVKSFTGVVRVTWDGASLLFQGQIIGPESISHDPVTGSVFTGTYDGLVWKIDKDLTKADIVLRTGDDHPRCGTPELQNICGRVLGLKFVSMDRLIVADAYLGIISVNVNLKTKHVLVHTDSANSLKLFNSVDVSKDGIVYFTVASTKWDLNDFIYSFIEADSTGRVYSYNLETHDLTLMASNLTFANGIVITHEGDSLLVAECTQSRILKIDIKEPTKISIFMDNLPGPTDNIKEAPDGSYFVAIPSANSMKMLSIMFSNTFIRVWSVWLMPKWMLYKFFNFKSCVLQIDGQGQIIRVIDGHSDDLTFITEAYHANGNLFLGSIKSPHLAVIRRDDNRL